MSNLRNAAALLSGCSERGAAPVNQTRGDANIARSKVAISPSHQATRLMFLFFFCLVSFCVVSKATHQRQLLGGYELRMISFVCILMEQGRRVASASRPDAQVYIFKLLLKKKSEFMVLFFIADLVLRMKHQRDAAYRGSLYAPIRNVQAKVKYWHQFTSVNQGNERSRHQLEISVQRPTLSSPCSLA